MTFFYQIQHGNRASTSLCGSADLLEAAGCNIHQLPASTVSRCVEECGFCFLNAGNKFGDLVASVRRELKFPTLFNVIGPLLNPSRPTVLLLGVNVYSLGSIYCNVLRSMGVMNAMVVHGAEGLDEV